ARYEVGPIIQQARDYSEADDNLLEKLIKVRLLLGADHPFAALRVREILDWAESEQWLKILQGDYVREGEVAITPASGWACPDCRNPIGPSDDYCPSCRARFTGRQPLCASCGRLVRRSWKSCPACGNQLESRG